MNETGEVYSVASRAIDAPSWWDLLSAATTDGLSDGAAFTSGLHAFYSYSQTLNKLNALTIARKLAEEDRLLSYVSLHSPVERMAFFSTKYGDERAFAEIPLAILSPVASAATQEDYNSLEALKQSALDWKGRNDGSGVVVIDGIESFAQISGYEEIHDTLLWMTDDLGLNVVFTFTLEGESFDSDYVETVMGFAPGVIADFHSVAYSSVAGFIELRSENDHISYDSRILV